MISDENKNAINVLKKAIGILTPRGAWCQGKLEDEGAVCAFGALCKASSGDSHGFTDNVARLSVRKVCGGQSIVNYNDYFAKRKSQVIAKFRKAIRLLESGATF
jgi:hypothetical protein